MSVSKWWLIFTIPILVWSTDDAGAQTGSLTGKISHYQTGDAIQGVLVKIEGTAFTTHTDSAGRFGFAELPTGTYQLLCIKGGYYITASEPLEIVANRLIKLRLTMLPGEPSKFLYFSIGGITVTADRNLLPQKTQTTYRISSGEIEHLQATNLGDILDLIPGVERTAQPGLQNRFNVLLRQASGEVVELRDRSGLFGTRILVDGIPLSNNANLNSGIGVGYGRWVQSGTNMGVDLRKIPADNVKKVDVIPGVPSVEYGDVTGGIIKVQTRDDVAPLRIKLKHNPDTREWNAGGGLALFGNSSLHYNLNNAYSLRDLSMDGDEVYRLNLQTRFTSRLWNDRLTLQEKIGLTRFFEDYAVRDDPRATRAYNHDYHLLLGQSTNFKLTEATKLHFQAYVNYTRRNSYLYQRNVVDPVYVTDRMEPGTQPGVLLSGLYFKEVTTTGKELHAGTKLNFSQRLDWKGMTHHFLMGTNYVVDGNRGEGKQFDPLRPLSLQVGLRPRSYDDLPDFHQLSFYFSDQISGEWKVPFAVMLGMRGEIYNPEIPAEGGWIGGKNGLFWNPRIGLRLQLLKNLQLRVSYAQASKAPSLVHIYPDPLYVDVKEIGRDGLDTLMTTYVYPLINEHLKGYRQRNRELALDYQYGRLGVTLSGFMQKTTGYPRPVSLPYRREVYRWPNWPSPQGKNLESAENMVLPGFEKMQNLGWVENYGMDVLVKTRRIPGLNMMFHFSGAYVRSRHGSLASQSVSSPVAVRLNGSTPEEIFPIYPTPQGWREQIVLKYNLDYVSKTLGIWLTFSLYHKVYEKVQEIDSPAPYGLATGYFREGNYYRLTPDKAKTLGLKTVYGETDRQVFRYPANYYFNITVSKDIYEGMEVSLFINNIFNERGFYYNRSGNLRAANPEIFYGMELSMLAAPLARQLSDFF